ncbi:glycosyltransferase family 39 protein [Kaarinaea lacus]
MRIQNLSPLSATLLLITISSLLHLLVAGRVELSGDEAHYALYGANIDWSYFDHPPLAGWLNAIVLLFSNSDFALRVLPVLMFAGTSLVIYRLAIELFPESNTWIGFNSVAILQSGILFNIIALAMIPETPLLLFSSLAILYLWRALKTNRLKHWIIVGLCFGLAGLSKYTAVTLVFTALLFIHFSRRWEVVRTPGPWIAFALAFLLITPVLYWNATHDWMSFAYQLGHGFHKPEWSITRFLITQGAQFAVYSPGIYILGLWAIIAGFRQWHHPGVKLILVFTLPVLLLFNWGGGYEESLPHWTSLAWAGLSPLTARWIMIHWQKTWVRVGTWLSGSYSLLIILLLHSLLFSPWLALPEDKNILRDLYGWRDATKHAQELANQMAITPGGKPVIMVNNWSIASRLAWYSHPQSLIVSDTRVDQFDLWYGGPEDIERGIMVIPAYFKNKQTLKTKFHRCNQIDRLAVKHRDHTLVTYLFFECLHR